MASCMAGRKDHLFMAKVAEELERYDDMLASITQHVSNLSLNEELPEEEFRLLRTAYRNEMEPRRVAWRKIHSIEQKEELRGKNDHAKMARDTRSRIENDISVMCYGIVKLIDEKVMAGSKGSGKSKVVCLTVKGDYFRYLAEVKVDVGEKRQAAESALIAYKAAKEIADAELDPIHPARLGLAVNLSVFYYEVLNQSELACNVAEQAINEAITELTELPTSDEESDKKDVILIVQLLNENLTLWKSDMQSRARDELHVARSATRADKVRERRRRANAVSVPNDPINDAPSSIQDEIKKPASKLAYQEQEE